MLSTSLVFYNCFKFVNPCYPSRSAPVVVHLSAPPQVRKVPEINEEFAQSIRKDLTLEELTNEVEKAVMEEAGTSKKDARNRRGNHRHV